MGRCIRVHKKAGYSDLNRDLFRSIPKEVTIYDRCVELHRFTPNNLYAATFNRFNPSSMMKRTTFSVVFFCKKTKLSKKGTAPIYARITTSGQISEIHTQCQAVPEHRNQRLERGLHTVTARYSPEKHDHRADREPERAARNAAGRCYITALQAQWKAVRTDYDAIDEQRRKKKEEPAKAEEPAQPRRGMKPANSKVWT